MTNEPPDSNNFYAVSIIDVNQNEEQPGHQPGLHRNILRIFFAFLILLPGLGVDTWSGVAALFRPM
jgi:hypothetical protein